MGIQARELVYRSSATEHLGYLAWDDSASSPRPAVLIAHTWAGRGEFEEARARQLAEAGYVALVADLYGNGQRGAGPEENAQLMAPLMADRAELQARMTASLEALRSLPEVDERRVAAMGYCFGGLCVLDLARTGADIRGVVSFHGLFKPADNLPSPQISAKVLCLHGYDDPMVTPDAMQALADELTAAGADWQVHAYGNTVHAFTNPAANDPGLGALYSPIADQRAWRALQNFLDEVLA